MKKSLFILAFLFTVNGYGQTIFKGLNFGMSKSEAKKEFKSNKSNYNNIDIGDGFVYRIYTQNLIYDDNKKLVGVVFNPKGSMMGQDYDEVKQWLTKTRSFFEKLGYETYIDNEWWNAPLNYIKSNSKWGLVLNKKDKTTMMQMFPQKIQEGSYIVNLRLWHHNTFVGYVEDEEKRQKDKSDNSGF